MPKNKPSLYRGDYYTLEEYRTLSKLLYDGKNLIETLLRIHTAIGNNPEEIKLSIKKLINPIFVCIGSRYNGSGVYDLLYNTHLNDVALYINTSNVHSVICQWRFQINK